MRVLLIVFFFFVACHGPHQSRRGSIPNNFSSKSGKLKGPMILEIQPFSQDSSRLLLSANIKPLENFGLARVEWKVPEYVKVHEGLLQQELELKMGQIYQVRLTLNSGGLKQGDQIFLFVYKMKNGERHGASTSYTHRSPGENSSKDFPE